MPKGGGLLEAVRTLGRQPLVAAVPAEDIGGGQGGGGVEGRGGVVCSHARDRCSERVGLGCLRPATACLRARLQRFLRYPLQTIMSW